MTLIGFPPPPRGPNNLGDAIDLLLDELDSAAGLPKEQRMLERIIKQLEKLEDMRGNA